jgi:hypothetical protein
MSKLWTFGDSFTFGHGCRPILDESKEAVYHKTFLDYIDLSKPIWPEIVAETFNLDLINKGVNGITNDRIFDYVLKNITEFEPNDCVIIQISTSSRFDFPFAKERNLFGSIKDSKDDLYEYNNSSHVFKTVYSLNILKDFNDGGETTLMHTNGEKENKNFKLTKDKFETIKNFFSYFIYYQKYYEREIWRFIKITELLNSLNVNVFILNEDIWPLHIPKPKNLIDIENQGLLHYIIENKKTIVYDTGGKINDFHPSYDGHIEIGYKITKHIENTNLYNLI